MDLQLKDKVVIITGGAKGIGAAISRACAREGAVPVIVDRDAESSEKIAAELRALGPKSHFIAADLTSPDNCRKAVVSTAERFGRIDALVNNAGINDKIGLEHGNPEDFVRSLERNLLHYYCMAHYSLPHLKRLARPHRKHQLKNRSHRPRRHLRIRSRKRRRPGPHARMGRGAAPPRHSRKCDSPRRSHDARSIASGSTLSPIPPPN